MTEQRDFHLVDGHAGTAHIDSDSLARKNQAVLGYWDDILRLHNRFKVTVLDATHVQLWNGGGYIKGRFFYKDTYTKLEVKAGTAGLNRWDALVMRYHRDGEGVETVKPLIITGTATSGQPSLPPTLQNNDPYNGSRDADLLLGRVELTGTNISYTGLANQADSVKSIGENVKTVENSLSQFTQKFEVLQFRKLVSDPDTHISGFVFNGIAVIAIRWTNLRRFHMGVWDKRSFAEITNGWQTDHEAGNWDVNNTASGSLWFSLNGGAIDFRSRSPFDIGANSWHLCQIVAPVHK